MCIRDRCNALPVGSKPVFTWERQHQSTAWRDLYGHVHWPWLVYQFRENRALVDATIAPLAQADREIREFATAGQKLVEAFRHRYAAFKADLLPGDVQAPRLLVKAYEIYRARQERGAASKNDETIYIGAQERTNPTFDPFPLINCSTLELKTRGKAHATTLPKRGNGAGKAEIAEWNRSVGPLKQGKTVKGELIEGQYELMIIGERDIKR